MPSGYCFFITEIFQREKGVFAHWTSLALKIYSARPDLRHSRNAVSPHMCGLEVYFVLVSGYPFCVGFVINTGILY